MSKKLLRRLGVRVGGPLLILLVFLFTTNPNSLPIIFLVVPFVLLFITLYNLILLAVGARVFGGPKRYGVAFILAGMPVVALVLQSINQLSVRDSLLLLVFSVILIGYITKFRRR